MTGCEGQDCSKCVEKLKCLTTVKAKEDKRCYSEFGRGLVTCLVKFAEHARQLDLKTESTMSESARITLWANGASDHLYEIEVPQGSNWDEIRKQVKALQDKALEIGHGFIGKENKRIK